MRKVNKSGTKLETRTMWKYLEIFFTMLGLIGSASGVIIYGDNIYNTIYNNTTTCPKSSELPNQPTSNVLPTSGPSSEPDENKTPVTSPKRFPGVELKEDATNNYFTPLKNLGYSGSTSFNNSPASSGNGENINDPTISFFDVMYDEIVNGESTTLSWSVSGATYVTIMPGIGEVSSSGSMTVNPTKTTTYTITAINKAESNVKKVTVSVKEIEPPTIKTFKINSDDDSATLNWEVFGDAEVTIEPDIGVVSSSGSIPISPIETTTYIITATNKAGSDEKEITFEVDEIEPSELSSSEDDSEYFVSEESTEPY